MAAFFRDPNCSMLRKTCPIAPLLAMAEHYILKYQDQIV